MPILNIYDQENKEWAEIPALKGSAATLEIDEVVTLAPNEQAYVTNTGDEYNAKLTLGIPRGINGITPVRGTDYWTAEDQAQIINDVSEKLDYSFDTLMTAIQNKPVTYILTNKAQLDSLLDLNNNTITYNDEVKTLNPGDVFLLTSTEEPDYWFGEDTEGNKLHELDARKIDLTQFVKTENMKVLSLDEWEATTSPDSSTFYFIYEGQ